MMSFLGNASALGSEIERASLKVSIVTPSLNQGQFIEETILSIKNQNYPYLEHIIVDGGSTDNTLEVLRRHEGSYDIKWISEPDRGHPDAVNKGFAMATGEVLGWINSDDLLFDLNTIGFVAVAFANDKEMRVLYGDSVLINENNILLRVECKPPFRYNRLLRGCFLTQPSVFFHRDIVGLNLLDIELHYAMDHEYWLRIGKKYAFHHVDRILSADRYHSVRKIVSKRKLVIEESWEVMRRYGQTFCPSYYLGRIRDKFSSAWLRLKGLKRLIAIRAKDEFAFEAQFDGFIASSYRQLVVKNRNLVKKRKSP